MIIVPYVFDVLLHLTNMVRVDDSKSPILPVFTAIRVSASIPLMEDQKLFRVHSFA
jgi:hypothetical protein